MKIGTFSKRIFAKKTNRIIAIVIFFALLVAILIVSVRVKNVRAQDTGTSKLQSTAVTKGSISNTIDASGNLEAAETVDITVPAGIKADEIKVESGEQVTKGQTLATLNKTSVTRLLLSVKDSLDSVEDELDKSSLSSLEKEELKGEKSELKAIEKKLTALYKKPVITASSDGIIGAVNISENAEISNNSSSAGSDAANSTEQSSDSLSKMSSEDEQSKSLELLFLTADTTADAADGPDDSSNAETQLKTINDYSSLSIQTPVTGETPQKSIQETSMYKGTISWDCSGDVFQSGTVYTATIVLTAKSGCTFSEKNLPIIKDASFNWNIYHSGEGNTLKIVAKYEKTSEAQNGQDNSSNQSSSGNGSENSKTGDTTSKTPDANSENTANGSENTGGNSNGKSDSMTGAKSGGASGSMTGAKSGGASGSMAGGASGSSSSNSTSSSTASGSSAYSAYEAVAFTIAKQDNAKIVVNVDELDILSVAEEQTAVVTLDALENEQYTGTVTKISNTASAGNGSTKYDVEITVPMNENMKIGMSASAAIQVSQSEDTLLLPMVALQQKGEKTFVYTSKNEDGELSGAVTVETGLSDGQNVEILNGVSEGTEVYYMRTSSGNEDNLDNGGGFPDFMNGNGTPGTPPDDSRRKHNSEGSGGGTSSPGGRPSRD